MRITGRCWATAFGAAALAHAGVVAVMVWQTSDPGAGTLGPGMMRVSLDQAGGAPAGAVSEISRVPEAEIVTVVETASGSPVEEAASAEEPITPLPVESVNAATAATPDDAVPVESAVQAVNLEISEPEPIAVVETAVPVRTVDPETAVQATTPDVAAQTVNFEASEPEAITVAETAVEPPVEEAAISVSPEPVRQAHQLAGSIEAETYVQAQTPVDPAPPDADVEFIEHDQPVRALQAQPLVFAATVGPHEEAAGRTAMASPPSAENDSGRSAIPESGSGAQFETVGDRGAHRGYLRKVLERIARFKRYPRAARRDGVVGKVTVRFIILADGNLQSWQLVGSSGDSRLDQAALDMLSRASPFPPIPRSLGMGKLELSLPVQFSLSQKRTLF